MFSANDWKTFQSCFCNFLTVIIFVIFTGGLFTDWQKVAPGYANLGFPIVEVESNGDFELGKPPKTGGIIAEAAVAEQMLYEVGDPRNYLLPDVNCDFTNVKMTKTDHETVKVTGAKGKPATK
jgi:hypothetical protein